MGTSKMLVERDIRVCGVVLLLSFLCSIPVNKIPHCGIAVISNTTVCDVCAFKPTVFSKMKFYVRCCGMDRMALGCVCCMENC